MFIWWSFIFYINEAHQVFGGRFLTSTKAKDWGVSNGHVWLCGSGVSLAANQTRHISNV